MGYSMAQISVKPLLHSVSAQGYALFTGEVTLPGMLLPEFNTHREASRSFSSLRAMPVAQALKLSGFRLHHYGMAQPGMQSLEIELEERSREIVFDDWNELEEHAARLAKKHSALGLAKQYANRPLGPYLYARGVISGTSQVADGWPFANLLHLRAKSMKVEPHMYEFAWCLADAIYSSMSCDENNYLNPGEWHLPYITEEEKSSYLHYLQAHREEEGLSLQDMHDIHGRTLAMASAMRCARASYNKLDGSFASVEQDAADAQAKLLDGASLDDLDSAVDLHGSPFEHQARCPMITSVTTVTTYSTEHSAETKTSISDAVQSGNFRGWEQFRHLLGIKPGTFTDADYLAGRQRVLRSQENT